MANRVVIIGGVAAGPKVAARARRLDTTLQVTLVERQPYLSYAGCGMPYYLCDTVGDLDQLRTTQAGLLRDAAYFQQLFGITVELETEAVTIDRRRKQVVVRKTNGGELRELPYDRLVLTTGAHPVVPPFPGTDLPNVHCLSTLTEAEELKQAALREGVGTCVIVGGGLIGLECAEAFVTLGLDVTVVEALPHLAPALLDPEPATALRRYLEEEDVSVRVNEPVCEIVGEDRRAVGVRTEEATYDADLVLLAVGVRPNVDLAREAGLKLGVTGALAVDAFCRTSDPDIYAGGDCVECTHLVTGDKVYMPLGSTANKHGRVIGTNLAGGEATFPGVVGATVFQVLDYHVGRTGLTETQARRCGFDVVTSVCPGFDRPHYFPGHSRLLVKLVADRSTGKLLGVQVVGPGEAAKRVDVVTTLLTTGGTAAQLATLDLAYAPPYSQALDLLLQAANMIENKRQGTTHTVTLAEVQERLAAGENLVLVDVRTAQEHEERPLDLPGVHHIPVTELRARSGELPRDAALVCFCAFGPRSYLAEAILTEAGFSPVAFLEGGMAMPPG